MKFYRVNRVIIKFYRVYRVFMKFYRVLPSEAKPTSGLVFGIDGESCFFISSLGSQRSRSERLFLDVGIRAGPVRPDELDLELDESDQVGLHQLDQVRAGVRWMVALPPPPRQRRWLEQQTRRRDPLRHLRNREMHFSVGSSLFACSMGF